MSSTALAELAATRRPSATAQPPERFSLLLLEDGEYFFRSHTAYYWPPEGTRLLGSLKVCSRSLFFVPRDVQQPIFRVPYEATSAVEALDGCGPHGEDQFEVAASTRVDMRAGGVDAPYAHQRGAHRLRFSLVYASLEGALPLVEELLLLAHAGAAPGGGSKGARAEVAAKLDEIIREHEEAEQFNPGWLEEEESVVVEAPAAAVSPLAAQPGRAVLTQHRIYFQPFNASVCAAPLQAYSLSKVVAVAPRVYQLADLGLEVFFSSRHSLYLAFRSPPDRAAFQRLLMQQPALQLDRMRSREQWTRGWVNGRISNFDYLMHLNREAGRSFKDLSQYPVMPWVVADYTSPTLDLSDPATYRDLSKPIGALNPRRLADFQQRYAELKQMMGPPGGDGGGKRSGRGSKAGRPPPPGAPPPLDTPPFLYGCHYSSPGYVVFYLMRSDPQLMLRLQNGRFDAPDRLFWSIADTWKSVLTLPSDVKELVPEFYSNDPSFLLNQGGTDFGRRSGGEPVGDVALPPWAADARDFLWKLQEALESPHVSARLHKWIDLVFGRKARGVAAEKADNVFHYLTYDDVALRWLDSERDPSMRDALRLQMMEFGRTPRQLFTGKHPKRRVLGRAGIMACFACLGPPAVTSPRPTNQLTGKPYTARSIPPVSRAVFKLSCTPQREKRQALLAFLEQTAAAGEPDAMALRQTRGAELFLLVKAARTAQDSKRRVSNSSSGSPAKAKANGAAVADNMAEDLVRAVAALAVCPQNRRYILEAGCLDVVGEALCAPQSALATAAVQGLALLAREHSPRLQALEGRVLDALLCTLRQPPTPDALLPALAAISALCDAYSTHRAYFERQGLQDILLQQLQSSDQAPAAAASTQSNGGAVSVLPAASARPSVHAGLSAGHRAESRAMRRRISAVGQSPQLAEDVPGVQAALLRRQRLLALAVLLQDESQRAALLGAGDVLRMLLADCSSVSLAVRSGAFECLASLTATDTARQQVKDLHLLPLLLEGAASGAAAVQQPAAAAVANLCSDPALVVAELGGTPQGLSPVVSLALAADEEVQRSAAAALWHLSVHPEARALAVQAGALSALLSLATKPRNVAAQDLARQGLVRCCGDDAALRVRVEQLAAAQGMDAAAVAAMLTPTSARSFASVQRKARHRKLHSDVPSSLSGAISRSSSFRSAADMSPAFANRAAPTAERSSNTAGGQSPMASAAAAAAAAIAASAEPAAFSSSQPSSAHLAAAGGSTGAVAAADGVAHDEGSGAPPGEGHQPSPLQQSAPPALRVPEGPSLPLPLPIITPVGLDESDSPQAARQEQQAQQPKSARLRSLAAEDAVASSPRGLVANRVQQLERSCSGLGNGGSHARGDTESLP